MSKSVFALVLAAVCATSAQAATLTAASKDDFIGGLTITYTDTNGDSLLDLA